MAIHNKLGFKGETAAAAFLERKGFCIRDRNWRCGRAEVDIIAELDGLLVFVEVKTRSSLAFGFPEDFVSRAQEKMLLEAAEEYAYRCHHIGEMRFDIISILADRSGNLTINHIEDAFWG